MAPREDWHLDKKVGVAHLFSTFAIILTLGGQAYVFGKWSGQLDERMGQVERRLVGFAERDGHDEEARSRLRDSVAKQGQDIAVLVSQLAEQSRQMDRLYTQMETNNDLLRDLLVRNGNALRRNE